MATATGQTRQEDAGNIQRQPDASFQAWLPQRTMK
jgi:hypothetical protein